MDIINNLTTQNISLYQQFMESIHQEIIYSCSRVEWVKYRE
jgi:hypothetical protein